MNRTEMPPSKPTSSRLFLNATVGEPLFPRSLSCSRGFSAGERLRQHYGQQDARNYLKRTVKMRRYDYSESNSDFVSIVFNFIITFLCFGAPYSSLRRIDEFFTSGPGRTDTIIERWVSFVDDNVADWTNTNLVVCFCL